MVNNIQRNMREMKVVLPKDIKEKLYEQFVKYVNGNTAFRKRLNDGSVWLGVRRGDQKFIDPPDRLGIVRDVIINDDKVSIKYELNSIITPNVKDAISSGMNNFVAIPACLCNLKEETFDNIVCFALSRIV